MPHSKHIAIIGGGAIGLCTAFYMQRAGHKVTILEKGRYEEGASLGNAGMLVPSHVVPLAAPGVISQGMRWLFRRNSPFRIKPRLDLALASWLWQFRSYCNNQHVQSSIPILRDLSLASVDLFQEMADDTELSFHLKRDGLLMLHHSEKGATDNQKYAKLARSVGLEVEILTASGLRELEPEAPQHAKGGVYYPQDAHLSPNDFIRQLRAHLEQEGVVCHTNTTVDGFGLQNKRITTVRTPNNEFPVDEVVLATGAWSPSFGKMLGIKIPIQPAKGYSITVDAPANPPKIPMILSEEKVTVTPMSDRLRFGGTLELAGFDASVDLVRASSILNTIPYFTSSISPKSIQPTQIWSGYRPCTPDGLPMIGRSSLWQNLILATGHAMIGITLAPITGKLVTEIASGKPVSIPIQALSPDRFQAKSKRRPLHPDLQIEVTDA